MNLVKPYKDEGIPEYDVDIFEIDSRDYNVEVYCKNLFDNRTKEGWRFISQDTKLLSIFSHPLPRKP